MAKVRDLGISVIPMTMRPLEIGPGAGLGRDGARAPQYWACADNTACEACQCANVSDPAQETTCNPSGDYDDRCKPTRPQCPPPSKPNKYHGSGFTNDAVLQLKQQLFTRISRKELQH